MGRRRGCDGHAFRTLAAATGAAFLWLDRRLPGPAENFAASEFAAGEFTDDTQQAIALMDALIAADGEVEPERIARNIIAGPKG